MSLPVELLEVIFSFCYLGCPHAVSTYSGEETTSSLSYTLRNFPYNLMAVDSVWEAILIGHSEYWTGLPHLVFYVDSKSPTHIDDAKTILRYMLLPKSGSHSFHVAIIRRSKEIPDDASEKERLSNFMDLLLPGLQCFKGFLIDVHASSSLPSPTYFSNRSASSLINLEYLCDVDDSDDQSLHEVYDYRLPVQGSHITSMILDGYTFRRNTAWLRSHTMLKSLTISHLSHISTDDARGILDVFCALDAVYSLTRVKLTHLKFRDINPTPCGSMLHAFAMFMRLLNKFG
ncbi:hypothetical protein M413DRAFT_26975 [Hebeloma cylindrosporum]|uniref:F-box domain-containing protein n=1 Tax=Hebeloma cylindrosporum TaxID=76867 RepID=A0A0C2YMF1_HEBCY|nr:hypothetical protein M413DRAFT_26975 [Hebeloma cylindrosporum h7]